MMFETIVGIEIHAELKTKNKMFSPALNEFGSAPNKNVSVIDLGLPGTLPKINYEAIEMALKAALALNCKINKKMQFDRKNYFYPDLPKGYQITQNETPIGYDGFVEIEVDGETKKINIERIHIEEDTCKSLHEGDETYLDYNRAGVPLIEIVTKPDIKNDKEAILYLEKIREILLYLDVSDVKIEEGSMRCEANVSIKKKEDLKLGNKVEVKNIGSISNVGKAILFEEKRQEKLILSGEEIVTETRRYDEKLGETVLMRIKETKNDYRYFPEPDLSIIMLSDSHIEKAKKEMPLLPDEMRKKFTLDGISEINIKTIVASRELSGYFLEIYEQVDVIETSKILTSVVLKQLNKNRKEINEIDKEGFVKLVNARSDKKISSDQLEAMFVKLLNGEKNIEEQIENEKSDMLTSQDLEKLIITIIEQNQDSLDKYKSGDERVLKHFMGLIMKETKGKVDPKEANKQLLELLSKLA